MGNKILTLKEAKKMMNENYGDLNLAYTDFTGFYICFLEAIVMV